MAPSIPYNYRAPAAYYPLPYLPTPVLQNKQIDTSLASSEVAPTQILENGQPDPKGIDQLPSDASAPPQGVIPLAKGTEIPLEEATPRSITQPKSVEFNPGLTSSAPDISSSVNESSPSALPPQSQSEGDVITVLPSPENPVEEPDSAGVTKKQDPVEPAVPTTIELSLAEQLHQSQPQIEEAIRSGNFAEAYYLWRPLAEAGDPSAQYGIGWMYHNGYGLAIDDRKAHEWWSKAAEQEYVEAIFSIGTLYQFGYGDFKKDMKIALSYYLKATVAGHEESRLILRTMLERRDSRIEPILPALMVYYLKSAISGVADSQEILKKMLLNNDPRIEPILTKLLNYYRDSAISGEKTSQQILRTLMLKGDSRVEMVVAELLKSHPRALGNIPATVRVKMANTRMGPGTQYKVIKVVKRGDLLMVIEQQDGWLLCQLDGSDKRVWISSKLVTLNP